MVLRRRIGAWHATISIIGETDTDRLHAWVIGCAELEEFASAHVSGASRRFRFRIPTMLVLVATCACVFWATRVILDRQYPVDLWIRMLHSRRPADRITGAMELAREASLDDPAEAHRVLPVLLGAMTDRDPEVRVEVIRSLRIIDAPIRDPIRGSSLGPARDADLNAVAATLIAARNDSDPVIRGEVLGALRELGPHARLIVPSLIADLNDPSANLRVRALRALAWVRTDADNPRIAPLLIRLIDDADPGVRSAALDLVSLSDPNGSARTIALVIRKLHDPDTSARNSARLALARDPNALQALTATLGDRSRSLSSRRETAEFLLHRAQLTAPQSVAQLGKLLDTCEPELKPYLVRMLGYVGREPGIEILLRQTNDRDPQLVASVLGHIAEAYRRTSEAHPTQSVVALLKSNIPQHRRQAFDQLDPLAPTADLALPALADLSRGKDPEIRSLADRSRKQIEKCVILRDRVRREAVRLALNHPSSVVCYGANALLRQLGPTGHAAIPRDRLMARAIAWLNDSSGETQFYAMMLVVDLRAVSAIPKLTELTRSDDEIVRDLARFALSALRPESKGRPETPFRGASASQ
jgi:HEAT repeat protein